MLAYIPIAPCPDENLEGKRIESCQQACHIVFNGFLTNHVYIRHFHCYLGIWQLKDLKDAISSEELGEVRLVVTRLLLAEDEAGMLASFS